MMMARNISAPRNTNTQEGTPLVPSEGESYVVFVELVDEEVLF